MFLFEKGRGRKLLTEAKKRQIAMHSGLNKIKFLFNKREEQTPDRQSERGGRLHRQEMSPAGECVQGSKGRIGRKLARMSAAMGRIHPTRKPAPR